MQGNPFIEFIRTYGPSASSDSLYDEHIQSSLQRYGVDEIQMPAPLVGELGEFFTSSHATNVILTGTAGDGKTYHLRRVYFEYLGGNSEAWPGNEFVIKTSLSDGRELRIIRDLSELKESDKNKEIGNITASLAGKQEDIVYLIAVNDGQLLEMWRTAAASSPKDPLTSRVHTALATMLQKEAKTDPQRFLRVHLYNLSRMVKPSLIDEAINKLLTHPLWEEGCRLCPLDNEKNKCPIKINRQLLLGNIQNEENSFHARLREMLELASANDQHIPVRQMLTLVVNIILGDSGNFDDPLLTCNTASQYASQGRYQSTNPYDNAVGENLTEDVRSRYTVFSTLETFGIGYETTNEFDDLILYQRPESVTKTIESADPIYGDRIFQGVRTSYVNAPRERLNLKAFSKAMVSQRRRLFFHLPSSSPDLEQSYWLLTVFRHGRDYLEFREAIKTGLYPEVSSRIERGLLKGLNRALTGLMADETEALWLATSIGKLDNPTGRITVTPEINRTLGPGTFYLKVTDNPSRNWLEMKLESLFPLKGLQETTVLEIRPQILEYLLRVADGSLPSSFSRQCHQEIKHFAMMLRQALHQVFAHVGPTIRLLSLDSDASIKANPIKVIES